MIIAYILQHSHIMSETAATVPAPTSEEIEKHANATKCGVCLKLTEELTVDLASCSFCRFKVCTTCIYRWYEINPYKCPVCTSGNNPYNVDCSDVADKMLAAMMEELMAS